MFKILFISAIISLNCFSVEISEDFLKALATVESSNNQWAYNKKEKAKGLYQIRPIYLRDVNRILNASFTNSQCYSPTHAKVIVRAYLKHYGNMYEKRTGRKASYIILSKIHNGGGVRGVFKKSTIPYAIKVMRAYNKILKNKTETIDN